METLERTTQFVIVFTNAQLDRINCQHNQYLGELVPGCRGCSVTFDMMSALESDQLFVEFRDEWITFPTAYVRRFEGWTSGPDGKRALSRMIALAYGHPDPITLDGWRDE